jgi:hypothetical protein
MGGENGKPEDAESRALSRVIYVVGALILACIAALILACTVALILACAAAVKLLFCFGDRTCWPQVVGLLGVLLVLLAAFLGVLIVLVRIAVPRE